MSQHTITPDNVLTDNEDTNSYENELLNGIDEQIKEEEHPLLKLFAPKLAQLIKELAEKNKFPVEYSIAALLFAFSLAIGKKIVLKVKKDWIESAALYLSIVAPVGGMKTPVIRYWTKVFRLLDASSYKTYQEQTKQWQEKKAAASKDNPITEQQPFWQQRLMSDFTVEASIAIQQHSQNGVGALVDELTALFAAANRYNKGNDIQMLLSMYNNETITVNRKGSLPIHVLYTFLSIIGGIQPGIVSNAFTPEMMANGLTFRFLFVCLKKYTKEVATEEEISPGLYESYSNMITLLLNIGRAADDKPIELTYTAGARELLNTFREEKANAYNKAIRDKKEWLAGVFSKCDYHVIRLSLIMQCIYDSSNEKMPCYVGEKAIQAAITLTDFFVENAKRVFTLLDTTLSSLTEADKQFYNKLPETEFSTADAINILIKLRADEQYETVKKAAIRFLSKGELFTKLEHGKYIKK